MKERARGIYGKESGDTDGKGNYQREVDIKTRRVQNARRGRSGLHVEILRQARAISRMYLEHGAWRGDCCLKRSA